MKKYMHISTGEVDTRRGFNVSESDFQALLEVDTFVEVVEVNGEWVEKTN
jgi:guanylate kinase